MLVLIATPRGEGRFRYSIEGTGIYSAENALAVALKLKVVEPYILLDRARDLGSVEIPEPNASK
jgi:hypothetical protein